MIELNESQKGVHSVSLPLNSLIVSFGSLALLPRASVGTAVVGSAAEVTVFD